MLRKAIIVTVSSVALALLWPLQAGNHLLAATITVSSTDDTLIDGDGNCTLREAIINANNDDQSGSKDCSAGSGPDTLNLQASATYTLSIGPSDGVMDELIEASGDLDITDALHIIGNNSTIDAAGIDRVFHMEIENSTRTPFTVTIQDVTVTGGSSSVKGGGICVRASTLNLLNSTVIGNQTDGHDGGGIAVDSIPSPDQTMIPAELNLTGSTVTNNQGLNGGGISCLNCILKIEGSTIGGPAPADGNRATGFVGGGAIFVNGNKGAVTITSGSKIINNGSTTNGGGIAVFSGNVTIDGSTISNNRADKDGGGIFNSDFSPGMITVTNSSMTQNTANSDGVAPGGDGGGIFHGAGSLTANFNRIVGNSADEGSGIAASDFPADARNNWWGCDDFPGADGCDTIKGTTDADPRLDLRLTAVPDTISVGDTSRLIADLTVNSDGTSIQPKLSVFNGLIVTFTGGTLGNLIPSSAIITDGMATTTFTAGAEGLTEVEATLDNRTERTAITIQSRADSAPPTLTVPSDITAEATGPSGAVVNYTVSASDNTDPSPTVVCTPHSGATFALGMTPVFCKATDASGNVAEASFDVRVVDTTPPMIKDFKATPDDLWSPNHKLLPVSLTVSATDAMDRTPACQVVSVDTNELIIRPGSDKDEPDWEITGPLSLNLRLERSGQYAGRMYRITVECTDTAGNISGASAYVHVPHDQRDKEG